jgi:hypothetical protein
MRFVRTAIIAGVATAALAGAALAAHENSRMMLVALPDGTVEHIRYQGDVAPQVVLVPAAAPMPAGMIDAAFGPDSPFAAMDRMAAAMEAHAQAMMRQAATMQAQMPAADGSSDGRGIVMTNAQGQPVGVMHYSFVSSSTDANGCTQTVRYSSDGANADQPRVIRTSAGNCSAQAAPSPAIAPADTRAASPVTPTRSAPVAKPSPRITPVSVLKPAEVFTPSRT